MLFRALSPMVLAGLLASNVAHARATFDATTGTFQLPKDDAVLLRHDFEDLTSLEGTSFVFDAANSAAKPVSLTSSNVTEWLTEGPDDVLEGAHAFRVGDGKGLMLRLDQLGTKLQSRRFEISFWAREDGANPYAVIYFDDRTASLFAVPTGRRTNDGWAELVFGPMDARPWGRSPSTVMILPMIGTDSAPKSASVLVDAVEIRLVDGAPTDPKACTQANAADVCGPEGACAYGHCVSSVFDAGPLPNEAQRRAFVERWIFFVTHVFGDRRAAAAAEVDFAVKARDLAKNAVSSSQFYGGLRTLVNRLRDAHTTFAILPGGVDLTMMAQTETAGILGACFGVVEKDLLGGGVGYGVFAASEQPMTGVALKKGDVLTAIDGQDPKAWVDTYWPRFGRLLPNDPASDWGASAQMLAGLVSTRASTLTFARCASATDCAGASRHDFTIDIGKVAYDAATAAKLQTDDRGLLSGSFSCSPRFTESVPHVGVATDDSVYVATTETGETRIQFDGVEGSKGWIDGFSGVFANRPPRVLLDARLGQGGVRSGVQALFDLLRDKDDPIRGLVASRRAYDVLDPPWGIDEIEQCAGSPTGNMRSDCSFLTMLAPSQTEPPGASSRIAWVNTVDVSANDFLPRLLRGRKDFRIFAPHPTFGAFGAVMPLPPLTPSFWQGGSIQVQDSKFGASLQEALSAPWESGVGVPPDSVVTQKVSDALAGVDTLLEAAEAWLKAP